jgi:hypothetical protein
MVVAVASPAPFGLDVSVKPSCLTLNSGGTAFATLIVAVAAVTPPGDYVVTVTTSFQGSPSAWVTGLTTTIPVTIVHDVYLVPAMLTVTVVTAAIAGGAVVPIALRKRARSERTRVTAKDKNLP